MFVGILMPNYAVLLPYIIELSLVPGILQGQMKKKRNVDSSETASIFWAKSYASAVFMCKVAG
jgi:hypothetical protein